MEGVLPKFVMPSSPMETIPPKLFIKSKRMDTYSTAESKMSILNGTVCMNIISNLHFHIKQTHPDSRT